jgi:hypothetical protein
VPPSVSRQPQSQARLDPPPQPQRPAARLNVAMASILKPSVKVPITTLLQQLPLAVRATAAGTSPRTPVAQPRRQQRSSGRRRRPNLASLAEHKSTCLTGSSEPADVLHTPSPSLAEDSGSSTRTSVDSTASYHSEPLRPFPSPGKVIKAPPIERRGHAVSQRQEKGTTAFDQAIYERMNRLVDHSQAVMLAMNGSGKRRGSQLRLAC